MADNSAGLRTEINCKVKIDGKEFPVSAFNVTFVVNSIPQAQIVIPTGRPANDEKDILKARDVAAVISQFKPLELWVKMTGEFAPNVSWPEDWFRVFNGYVSGSSLSRSRGTISIIVNAVHWLIDLDASMSLTDDLAVGAPVAIKLPSHNSKGSFIALDPYDPTLINFTDDLWLNALKPKFVEICKAQPTLTKIICLSSDQSEILNQDAENNIALPRLDGTGDGFFDDSEKVDIPHLTFTQPLKTSLLGTVPAAITKRLSSAALGSSSLWDKLLEFGKLFEFTLIPTVDSAVCAPVAPCLIGDPPPYHVTIKASEYFTFAPSTKIFRLWKGVVITGEYVDYLGSHTDEKDTEEETYQSAGCYLASKDEEISEDYRKASENGTIQFIGAPDWLQDFSVFAMAVENETRVDLNNTMRDVTEGENELTSDILSTLPESDKKSLKFLGDQYCKWWYWTKAFLPRTAQLSCKLRFDIAPGSIIRIEDIGGKLNEDEAEKSFIIAFVTSVSLQVDTVNNTANTTVTLSHLRREAEFGVGTERHPLYKDKWIGTVLQSLDMSNVISKPGEHENG